MGISRRDFMKKAAGVGAASMGLTYIAGNDCLGMTRQERKSEIRKYMEKAKLDRDWDAAIEENKLREEIANTIINGTVITYLRRPENASELKNSERIYVKHNGGRLDNSVIRVRRVGKDILEENLPIENLRVIRDYIKDFGPGLSSIEFRYKLIEMPKVPAA